MNWLLALILSAFINWAAQGAPVPSNATLFYFAEARAGGWGIVCVTGCQTLATIDPNYAALVFPTQYDALTWYGQQTVGPLPAPLQSP